MCAFRFQIEELIPCYCLEVSIRPGWRLSFGGPCLHVRTLLVCFCIEPDRICWEWRELNDAKSPMLIRSTSPYIVSQKSALVTCVQKHYAGDLQDNEQAVSQRYFVCPRLDILETDKTRTVTTAPLLHQLILFLLNMRGQRI